MSWELHPLYAAHRDYKHCFVRVSHLPHLSGVVKDTINETLTIGEQKVEDLVFVHA